MNGLRMLKGVAVALATLGLAIPNPKLFAGDQQTNAKPAAAQRPQKSQIPDVTLAAGGVFSGRLALENGLVDEIGGEPEALAWLESREEGLSRLPVRDWEVEREGPLGERILGQITPTGGILGEISRWTGPKLYSIGP